MQVRPSRIDRSDLRQSSNHHRAHQTRLSNTITSRYVSISQNNYNKILEHQLQTSKPQLVNSTTTKTQHRSDTMSTQPQQQTDSDTMSTASTLVPSSAPQSSSTPRTTLTGNPITYKPDNLSNMNAGVGCWNVGANTLPPGYTDTSLVHIPIKTGEYLKNYQHHQQSTESGLEPPSEIKREKSGGVWQKISKRVSGSHEGSSSKSDDGGLKVVAMSRGDYLKYWVKGDDGKFKAGVVEPEEGRAEWLVKALERQEREGLGKVAPRSNQGYEGRATILGAAGALIGGASC